MASSGCETEEETNVSMEEIKWTPLFDGLRITFNSVKSWVEHNGSGTPKRLNISGFNKMLSGRDKIILRKVLPGPYLGNIQTLSYLLWKGSKLYGKVGPWKYVGEDWKETSKCYIMLNDGTNSETKLNGKQPEEEDSTLSTIEQPKDDVPDIPTKKKKRPSKMDSRKEIEIPIEQKIELDEPKIEFFSESPIIPEPPRSELPRSEENPIEGSTTLSVGNGGPEISLENSQEKIEQQPLQLKEGGEEEEIISMEETNTETNSYAAFDAAAEEAMNRIRKIPLCEGSRINIGTIEKYIRKKGDQGRLNISGFNKMISGQDKPAFEKVLPGPYRGNILTLSYMCWKTSQTYGSIGPWRFEGAQWDDTVRSFVILNSGVPPERVPIITKKKETKTPRKKPNNKRKRDGEEPKTTSAATMIPWNGKGGSAITPMTHLSNIRSQKPIMAFPIAEPSIAPSVLPFAYLEAIHLSKFQYPNATIAIPNHLVAMVPPMNPHNTVIWNTNTSRPIPIFEPSIVNQIPNNNNKIPSFPIFQQVDGASNIVIPTFDPTTLIPSHIISPPSPMSEFTRLLPTEESKQTQEESLQEPVDIWTERELFWKQRFEDSLAVLHEMNMDQEELEKQLIVLKQKTIDEIAEEIGETVDGPQLEAVKRKMGLV